MVSFTPKDEQNILVVGGGKMGSAMINGWLNMGIAAHKISLIDPNKSVLSSYKALGLNTYETVLELDKSESFDIFLLALKPQVIMQNLTDFNDLISQDTCLISVAAGVSIQTLKSFLPNAVHVVRVMPNTPAMIGKGVLVGFTDERETSLETLIEGLFSKLGKFYWVEYEDQMHQVTAISGSGPAYVFYFAQCFNEVAKELGLNDDLAKALALETLIGAASLIDESQDSVVQLRKNVTSPNGTTQAGLEVLMSEQLIKERLLACCKAAENRSRELA